ncbi:hypothetical protein TSTA_057590 [Talaromyces stipitatus ATCC 10500]|uniref:Uncharacterized protein n=1 Tax=Talaromyces stipitatus (strain ATCC 10500 / CBS 375.48 / QM 6759 / NRRL 1006) TaxID=441959 RepID=B8MRT5_TALSN|nr:uncharacterized protein TSTA_057590 [Talaromyces stipitatus ATCC 10500]EED13269.1 hypothetical protein TSTA_057590 [Talaromyces stipitatus ATCC 10500]
MDLDPNEAGYRLYLAACEDMHNVTREPDPNDLLHVWFEKHQDFRRQWRLTRLNPLPGRTEIERINNWFKTRPEIFLEFRKEVLLHPGANIPIPYDFGELVAIEAIYGGRIEIDVKVLMEMSDAALLCRMEIGFEALMLLQMLLILSLTGI